MLHYVLGFTAVEQQDYARAFALHTTSLAQALAIGNRLYVVYNLVGIAAVAMVNDAALRASRLAAAAETLLAAINSAMETAVRRQFERTTAAARAALGEEAFQTAWAEGEQLSLEEAVTYALEA